LDVPDVDESEPAGGVRVLALEPLLKMKLNSFRRKDWVHVRDMADVGLVDESWLERLPEPLRPRLREVLDNPDG
jgi:hypothetical protein